MFLKVRADPLAGAVVILTMAASEALVASLVVRFTVSDVAWAVLFFVAVGCITAGAGARGADREPRHGGGHGDETDACSKTVPPAEHKKDAFRANDPRSPTAFTRLSFAFSGLDGPRITHPDPRRSRLRSGG